VADTPDLTGFPKPVRSSRIGYHRTMRASDLYPMLFVLLPLFLGLLMLFYIWNARGRKF